MPRTMYLWTTIENSRIGITVRTPTVAAMFHSIGLSTVSRLEAAIGIVSLSCWLMI